MHPALPGGLGAQARQEVGARPADRRPLPPQQEAAARTSAPFPGSLPPGSSPPTYGSPGAAPTHRGIPDGGRAARRDNGGVSGPASTVDAPGTLRAVAEPGGGAAVLVVDDERKIVDLVRAYLERDGFRVLTAGDGPDALRQFRRGRPALVVLDLMLPGLSGWDVCRAIRAESDVPIVMLTARDDVTDAVLGLELGADDYVTKPFAPRELVARVRAHLRRARAPLRTGRRRPRWCGGTRSWTPSGARCAVGASRSR